MTPTIQSKRKPPAHERIPPLQNGDRLTACEFERRYRAMPDVRKAELIEGVVHMPSPVSHTDHGAPHLRVAGWIAVYIASTPGTDGGQESTVRLDPDNVPQPDAFLRILPEYGGKTKTSEDGYIVDAPELVVEVAASSVSYDLHDKLKAYRRNGVMEYVVWRVLDEEIDWFQLRDEKYEALKLTSEGVYKSEVFPGLWLDTASLLQNDLAKVLQVLQAGIASPEHAEFAKRLAAQRSRPSETGR
jgi:Uma2 family endonuclease